MSVFFNISHSELDSKINNLSAKIGWAQPVFGIIVDSQWEEIFQLCKQIQEDFKNVRYPTKAERDIAWKRFNDLRDKAYSDWNNIIFDRSNKYYKEIMRRLETVMYSGLGDFLIGQVLSLGLMKTTAEEMKANGRELKEIGAYFKSVKHAMTREHKVQVFEKILQVRKSHDNFWGRYKSYQGEKSRNYEEKKATWEEKQEKSRIIRTRIENNIEQNTHKLREANESLNQLERKRSELRDKIYDSNNYSWKSKAEGWLDEFDEKIRSKKDYIDRLEKWIEDDREKLRNWR